MKFKKMTAAALAAVLAASAPLAGAVSNALSVTANAEQTYDEREGIWYYRVNEDGETVCITRCANPADKNEIPTTLGGKKVTMIGGAAFRNSGRALTKVTIPNGVTTIGQQAFEGCWYLADVTIPNSVTTIGDRAFSDTALTNVMIPNGVTKIGASAFSDCKSLTSVSIPNSVTTIGGWAFSSTALTNVVIPNGVTKIGAEAFSDCKSLTSVTIPRSVTSIDFDAFKDSPVETVYYGGTKAEWEAIKIPLVDGVMGSDSHCCGLSKAKIIFTDDIVGEPDTSEPTSKPTTSEPTASKPAPDPTESTVIPGGTDPAAKPGGSDKPANQDIIEVTFKNVDSENGIEGEALDKLLFGDSGLTWEQVEKIEFSSDDLFSVQFSTDNGGWRKLGEEAAARADDENIWNTEWTLNTSEMAKDKKFAKVIAKDGIIDVTAKVYIKSNAEKPSDGNSGADQQPTGIALAIAPVVLAASAAIVVFKKKK